MLFIQAAALAALVAIGNTAPAPASHVLHEKRAAGSSSWRRGQRVDGSAIIPVRIGLTQSNLDDGYAHLMNIASSSSSSYGKHWTAEEVHSTFAPSEESVRTVRDWLVSSGIEGHNVIQSENRGWFALNIPARDAERLFSTELFEHEHPTAANIKVGCDQYYVPKHVQPHIDYVTPGVRLSPSLKKKTVKRTPFPQYGGGWGHGWKNWQPTPPSPPWKNPHDFPPWHMPPGAGQLPADLQSCGRNITPVCIRALYDIPIATLSDPANSLGVFEEGDEYSQQDLNEFFAKFAPNVPNGTHPIPAFIDGATAPVPQNSTLVTGESDIDLDIAFSLIYPQTVTLYQTNDVTKTGTTNATGELPFLETFLDALDGSFCDPSLDGNAQCGVYTPTRVITVSYTSPEFAETIAYSQRVCNEFMKLGLQGHTVMFASGDYGVASHGGVCLSADDHNQTVFVPQFPDNCPYILSVGATQLSDNETVRDAESAMNQPNVGVQEPGSPPKTFSSSGGFSNFFPAPSYQKTAISNYFSAHDPSYPYYISNGLNPEFSNGSNVGANGGIYNRAGRGIPDVSANGANLLVYVQGLLAPYYGTSLASPIWASIITLINEERTAAGKGPVGFINPVLYENTWALHDITNGSNPGCFTDGFQAVEGWDPVTGLGTPDYPALLRLFMGLQ